MSFEEGEAAALRRMLATADAQSRRQGETISKLERKIVAAAEAHKFLEEALQDERKMRAEFLAERNAIDAEVEEKSGTILQLENFRKMCEAEISELQMQNLSLTEEKKKMSENFEKFAETATSEIRQLQAKVADLEISLAEKSDVSAELFALERRWLETCEKFSQAQAKFYASETSNFQVQLGNARELRILKDELADARAENDFLRRGKEMMSLEISNLEKKVSENFETIAAAEEATARMQAERILEKNFLARKISEHNSRSIQNVILLSLVEISRSIICSMSAGNELPLNQTITRKIGFVFKPGNFKCLQRLVSADGLSYSWESTKNQQRMMSLKKLRDSEKWKIFI